MATATTGSTCRKCVNSLLTSTLTIMTTYREDDATKSFKDEDWRNEVVERIFVHSFHTDWHKLFGLRFCPYIKHTHLYYCSMLQYRLNTIWDDTIEEFIMWTEKPSAHLIWSFKIREGSPEGTRKTTEERICETVKFYVWTERPREWFFISNKKITVC